MRFLLSVLVAIAALVLCAMVTMPVHADSVFRRTSSSFKPHAAVAAELAAAAAAPAASTRSDPCSTSCSGAGTCVANQCQCNAGFLGVDCSIQAQMTTPACVSPKAGGAYMCLIYAYVKDVVYGRMQVFPSSGWGGFLFGTKSGMDNGTGLLFSYQNGAPVVQDMQSLKFSTPTILNVSSVPASSIVGFVNSTSGAFDIQFQRAVNTGIPGLFVLPTTTGVQTSVSMAVGTTYFKHHVAAQCTLTDLVALSEGQPVDSPSCPAPPMTVHM